VSLEWLSLSEMLAAIGNRRASPADIVLACARQITAYESQIRAFAHIAGEAQLLEIWQRSSRAYAALPFQGLPIGVKDTIDVRGLPAERGSSIWREREAHDDAACVSLLRSAGLHVLGKTVTTEFAYFAPGPTANPHNPAHTPGGSSSGSAAAVAAGMAPIALGSQTAASVIRPASFCGVAAWVATRGAVSLRGVTPLAQSLDSLGVFARDVGDLLLIEQHLRRSQGAGESIRPAEVLVLDAAGLINRDMGDAYESGLAQLSNLGIRVRAAHVPAYSGDWIRRHAECMAYETAQNLAFEYELSREQLSAPLRALIEQGLAISAEAHADQQHARYAALQSVSQSFDRGAVLIAPAAPSAAPVGLASTGRPDLSRPWQWLGLPQVCLPLARNTRSMPLGIQVIGPAHQDRTLIRQALWLQERLGWKAAPLQAMASGGAPSGATYA